MGIGTSMRGTPASVLYDGDGNPVQVNDNGASQVEVADMAVRSILLDCLSELKRIRFMLAVATEADPGEI